MLGYELQQFVMVSAEVWQDLHERYSGSLWPWQLVFLLLNALVLLRSRQRLFFVYIAACWLFLGVHYFMQYVSQVHTFAFLMGATFIAQGIALLVFKVLMTSPVEIDIPGWIKGCGYLVFGIAAYVPYSYLLEHSQSSFLLFGWGAEQTAAGTLALVVISMRRKAEGVLMVLPVLWLFVSAVAL